MENAEIIKIKSFAIEILRKEKRMLSNHSNDSGSSQVDYVILVKSEFLLSKERAA